MKYAILFILLTFASVWLIEVLARTRVHPIQYLLLGAAMCVFYLLELSLAEHLAFPIAYGIACFAVVAMIAAYGRVIFRQSRHTAVVTGGRRFCTAISLSCSPMRTQRFWWGRSDCLQALRELMFATRGIDWYGEEAETTASGR